MIWKKIVSFFRRILHGSLTTIIKKYVLPAIQVVDILKLGARWIPGEVDDRVIEIAARWLPEIAKAWNVVTEVVDNGETRAMSLEEITDKIREYLDTLPELTRNRVYREIAAQLSEFTSEESEGGEKITLREGVLLVEMAYQEIHKKTAA